MFTKSFKKTAALWSQDVTEHSHAMDLEPGVFKKKTGRAVALSMKRSVEASGNLKSTPFHSGMSMINFYINRAGKNLPEERYKVLNEAKEHFRKLYKKKKKSVPQ